MSNIRFVYTAPDGATHILIGADRDSFKRDMQIGEDRTIVHAPVPEEEYRAIVMSAIPAGATNVTEVPPEWQPTDRTFRDAWKFDGKEILVDMVKAREVSRAKVGNIASIDQAATVDDLKAIVSNEGK